MKHLTLLLSLAFAGTVIAAPRRNLPPHMDLEMSSAQYRKLLKKSPRKLTDDPAIAEAIKLGERLSQWIAKVNEGRSTSTAIRLTSSQTRRGIPIDKPNMYNPSIIKRETISILREIPKSMSQTLQSRSDVPDSIPMDDSTFITHARRIDRNYQSAARYKSVDEYRNHYIKAASKDVRGFYYLMTNKIGEDQLREVTSIPSSKLTLIKNALAMMCVNGNKAQTKCRSEVNQAFSSNTVADYYKKYYFVAKETWDQFFYIPAYAKRSDITWSSGTMSVPFNTPSIAKFGPYLKDNIEDEYRWNGWGIRLRFGRYTDGPELVFEPGVVPHVNGLGGNEIVMDSNQPIEEYESQWTIRHEFGHVLGLPDCYHEFYDTAAGAYVNYQLDITDLMCSRAGNMKERIFTELKNAYGGVGNKRR